jgi:predicted enzyme related to lactoylglutathione lyase
MTITGPDFISLQVTDLDRAAAFYEEHLGLRRVPGPPHAVVFDTSPIAFAVRDALPGADLTRPGAGVALWLHCTDAQALHDHLTEAGVPIVTAPIDGPFGRTFTFADPDGYAVTIHDKQ